MFRVVEDFLGTCAQVRLFGRRLPKPSELRLSQSCLEWCAQRQRRSDEKRCGRIDRPYEPGFGLLVPANFVDNGCDHWVSRPELLSLRESMRLPSDLTSRNRPIIGGALSSPAERFPNLFGNSKFLKEYPYFLPCAVPATFTAIIWLVTFLFLQEVRGLLTSTCQRAQ